MIAKYIDAALHSGGELIVYVCGQDTPFRGTIQEFDGQNFTLFHNGPNRGILWVLSISDVLSCGLVMPRPTSLDNRQIQEHPADDMSVTSASQDDPPPATTA